MKTSICSVVLFLLFLGFTGCGGQNVPLRGKVTFSDDKSPLVSGTVVFENEKTRSRGVVQPDGSYVVGTLTATDGIPLGVYKVSVSGAYKSGTDKPSEGMDSASPESLIDEKFANATTSGLTFTVDGKTKIFDFSVDKPKK